MMSQFYTSPPVSEREFQGQVRDLARLLGWKDYATWSSVHSPAGFPDLVLVRAIDPAGHQPLEHDCFNLGILPARLIFAELKTDKGKLTAPQGEWLWTLAQTCAEVYVWRPACWPLIERILRR